MSKKIDKYIPIIVFVLFVSVISILTKGRNINFTNIKHILNQSVALIISGMGVIFVMSQGSLDLTQGSILVLAPLIGIFSENAIPGSFIPVVILVGMLIGLMTGSIFSLLKVPSFVATLCLSFVLRNFAYFLWDYIPGGYVYIPFNLFVLDKSQYKIPILILIVLTMYYIFEFTKVGKYSKAIGSDEKVAEYSGVPVKKMKILAFVLSGMLGGVCSLFGVFRAGTLALVTGHFFEWDVLVAVLLGGTPLTGGANSKLLGVILGSITISVINNGLVLLNVPTLYQQLVKGLILITIISLSFEKEKVMFVK
ncbi:MAG TPA: ABC transporter permease [Atribacter sp.]|uniref:ABC transporter permease n=1 Tax=Atribacter sp. TaxID=2847780 RepID=UPI001754DA4A|nr:ABC transporter permease [Atribacter sp.]MDD3713997.1 ABC transporter permease [Atribacterota bacterium]MDI9594064.1 ABC transporter permease [Atribacterota bacterium]HHT11203.1 ABC transporter permease [Candidatus Atribacteria bacterium]HQK82981.1 ABC transporter permease [Atribacter sp.]